MSTTPAALRCPECDAAIDGNQTGVSAHVGDDAVRLAVTCRTCSSALEVISRSDSSSIALEAVDVDVGFSPR